MNSLSTATIERETRFIPQNEGLLEGRTVSLESMPRSLGSTESELWDSLIALASNEDEGGTVALASTLRRLREQGAQLVTNPDSANALIPKIRLTAGGMPERDYQNIRRRHLLPQAARMAHLLKTAAFASTDPLTRAAIASGARVSMMGPE